VVQEGDTWNGIATAYGLDGATLASANGLTLEDVLQPGQVLFIPQ
jgi:LysM repeat protein